MAYIHKNERAKRQTNKINKLSLNLTNVSPYEYDTDRPLVVIMGQLGSYASSQQLG